MKKNLLLCVALCAWSVATAAPVEKIRNERVIAQEITLQPGEMEPAGGGWPSVTVYLTDGHVVTAPSKNAAPAHVIPGVTYYREAKAERIKAAGSAPVRFVRIEFLGAGDDFVWGTKGFAPDYKLIRETRYARVYDIRIPAGGSEPQHTHRDRVVVCLSGAKLRHVLPDGSEQDSSLATDDCLWRLGQTHVGKNIGATPLWVIAIEPK
jgi:hypothetical protein